MRVENVIGSMNAAGVRKIRSGHFLIRDLSVDKGLRLGSNDSLAGVVH